MTVLGYFVSFGTARGATGEPTIFFGGVKAPGSATDGDVYKSIQHWFPTAEVGKLKTTEEFQRAVTSLTDIRMDKRSSKEWLDMDKGLKKKLLNLEWFSFEEMKNWAKNQGVKAAQVGSCLSLKRELARQIHFPARATG